MLYICPFWVASWWRPSNRMTDAVTPLRRMVAVCPNQLCCNGCAKRHLPNNNHIKEESFPCAKDCWFLFCLQWWLMYALNMKYCSVLILNCINQYSIKVNNSAIFCCVFKMQNTKSSRDDISTKKGWEMIYPPKKGWCMKVHIYSIYTQNNL